MNLAKLYEETYVNAVDWDGVTAGDDKDKRCAEAEQFLFTALLEHHELPSVKPGDCPFSLKHLARQVPTEKQKEIWAEVLERLPPIT